MGLEHNLPCLVFHHFQQKIMSRLALEKPTESVGYDWDYKAIDVPKVMTYGYNLVT